MVPDWSRSAPQTERRTTLLCSLSRVSAKAVAVRGNEIVYVDNSDGAAAFVAKGTQEVDLAGRTMMPGFVDAHLHSMAGGLIARGAFLETDDMDELMNRIRTAVAETDGSSTAGAEMPHWG